MGPVDEIESLLSHRNWPVCKADLTGLQFTEKFKRQHHGKEALKK